MRGFVPTPKSHYQLASRPLWEAGGARAKGWRHVGADTYRMRMPYFPSDVPRDAFQSLEITTVPGWRGRGPGLARRLFVFPPK